MSDPQVLDLEKDTGERAYIQKTLHVVDLPNDEFCPYHRAILIDADIVHSDPQANELVFEVPTAFDGETHSFTAVYRVDVAFKQHSDIDKNVHPITIGYGFAVYILASGGKEVAELAAIAHSQNTIKTSIVKVFRETFKECVEELGWKKVTKVLGVEYFTPSKESDGKGLPKSVNFRAKINFDGKEVPIGGSIQPKQINLEFAFDTVSSLNSNDIDRLAQIFPAAEEVSRDDIWAHFSEWVLRTYGAGKGATRTAMIRKFVPEKYWQNTSEQILNSSFRT